MAGRAAPFARDEVDHDVLQGRDPVADLADYADVQDDVGLIAMTTHGRRSRAWLVHPSTSLDLARHAPVPVLIVHPAVVGRPSETTPRWLSVDGAYGRQAGTRRG